MSCSICGKGTGPGAMLCRPCKAALKRARQYTVQALPGTTIAVTGPGDAFPVMTGPRSPGPAVASEQRRRTMLAALALSLFAAAAFVGGRGLAAMQAEREDAPALTTLAPRAPLPPPRFASPLPDLMPPATRAASVPPPARRNNVMSSPPVVQAAAAPSASTSATVAIAQAPDVVRTSATTAPAPVADRWQAVSDALARCAEEGGLSGFICDRRVRLDACDGYWGRVAQCPAPSLPANPR